MSFTRSSVVRLLFWLLATAMLIFLAFNRHSKTGIYYYRSQIFADKAGYYVYLPAALIYHFDAHAFPEKVDSLTGKGFQLDLHANKVITKYNYGVALLEFPFFMAAHLLSTPLGFEDNGFSLIYHWALDLSAIFYLMMAFWLLFKWLSLSFSKKTTCLTLVILFLGTNLFYYSILEGSMSHVYSFFLFATWITLITGWKKYANRPVIFGLLCGGIASMILLVRPVNVIFLMATFFFQPGFAKRIRFQLHYRFIIPFLMVAVILAFPQLAYWNYLSGDWLLYTYEGESFSNWANPQLIPLLFAPNNGLLIYNPVVIFIFIGLVWMIRDQKANGYLILLATILLIYASSAWWIWSFGCGYGVRNLVEYYTLLSIPLAWFLQNLMNGRRRLIFGILILLFCLYNLKMIYSYGGCWFGDGTWDWDQYLHWLTNWPA
ncbi:MAG: hypothetical protein P8100_00240 [bacterium]